MGMQLTTAGRDRFLEGVQERIAWATLINADGEEIEGWNYERREIDPEAWDGTRYPTLTWLFIPTQPGSPEPPQIVAGLGWQGPDGELLSMEPFVEPFVVNTAGQVLTVEPILRLFGVVSPTTVVEE